MIYLLDTNIIIRVLREEEDIMARYKNLTRNQVDTAITAYSIADLYEGTKKVP